MKSFVCALAVLALGSNADDMTMGSNAEDMTSVVTGKGYPLEQHFAVTEDGYVLGMFRIPYGRKSPGSNEGPRQAVFLQHALLDSSYAYVCNSPEQSIGFLLADAGYDVWFGNNRGNRYSVNHVKFDTDSKEFWDFTYNEMGKFDMPAQINYVLRKTGLKQVPFIGHSQGNMQAFAGLSLNSTLRQQISVMVALAPVAFLSDIESKLMTTLVKLGVDKTLVDFGVKEFLPQKGFINKAAPFFCDFLGKLCNNILGGIVGPSTHLEVGDLPAHLVQTPSGTSAKNVAHFGAGVRNGDFANWDGVPYDLSKVDVPVAFFVGGQDYLADLKDVFRLRAALPSGTVVKEWYEGTYAHLDFTWAIDVGTLMYPALLEVLQTYSPPALYGATMV